MNEEKKEEEVVVPSTTEEQPEDDKKPEGEQDPLKTELENVQNKKKPRTKAEKLIYNRKMIDQQLAAEGIDLETLETPELDDELDKPVTRRELLEMQAKEGAKSALQLADAITDDTERELTKHYLENTIKPSGDPQEDLRMARGLVNAARNKQIIDEAGRKVPAKDAPSGSGAPAGQHEPVVQFTAEELAMMQPPFNVTKDQVIAARATEASQK